MPFLAEITSRQLYVWVDQEQKKWYGDGSANRGARPTPCQAKEPTARSPPSSPASLRWLDCGTPASPYSGSAAWGWACSMLSGRAGDNWYQGARNSTYSTRSEVFHHEKTYPGVNQRSRFREICRHRFSQTYICRGHWGCPGHSSSASHPHQRGTNHSRVLPGLRWS